MTQIISSFDRWIGDAWGDEDKVRRRSDAMRFLVNRDLNDAEREVKDAAVRIVQLAGAGSRDYGKQVNALYRFVRDQVRSVRDQQGVDEWESPLYVLRRRYADCDGKTALLSALLKSIGFRVRATFVDFGRGYAHVLPEVELGTRWVPLETLDPSAKVGEWPPRKIVNRYSVDL